MVAAAMIGAAVVGGVASNAAASKAKSASKHAVDAANAASDRQANLAERQYEESAPYRQLMLEQAQKAGKYADTAEQRVADQYAFERGNAQKYSDRYWGTQIPLEDEMLQQARETGTDAYKSKQAGLAMASTRQQFDNMMGSVRRGDAARGVNPNSGAARALVQQAAIQEALGVAGAGNNARMSADQMHFARMSDVAALGRGLPGFSSNSSQLAGGFNSSGSGTRANGMNTIVAGSNGMNSSFGTGSSLWGSSASSALGGFGAYNTALNTAYRDPMMTSLGGISGGLAGYGFGNMGGGGGGGGYFTPRGSSGEIWNP